VVSDLNGNGQFDPTSLSVSTSPNINNSNINTYLSTLNVSTVPSNLDRITVTFDLQAGSLQAVDLFLISPSGTRVELSTNLSGVASNSFNYFFTLDDRATRSIRDAARNETGTYRPEGSLASVRNEALNGTWTFEVKKYTTSSRDLAQLVADDDWRRARGAYG
jgi:subtilisin-like proprotein convertase family protein